MPRRRRVKRSRRRKLKLNIHLPWKWIAIIVCVVVLIGLLLYGSVNSVSKQEESTKEQWSKVLEQSKQTANISTLYFSYVENVTSISFNSSDIVEQFLTVNTAQDVEHAFILLHSKYEQSRFLMGNFPTESEAAKYIEYKTRIEGIDTSLKQEINEYNSVIEKYNAKVRKFPHKFIAPHFGYEQKEKIELEIGSHKGEDKETQKEEKETDQSH